MRIDASTSNGVPASVRRITPSCLLTIAAAAIASVVMAVPGLGSAEPADEDPHDHAHEHDHGDEHEPTEEIVVTASPLAHSTDELAIPVNILDRDEIVQQLGTTLGETLRNEIGITTTGFSAGVSRPVIRGQDAFRTEVLEGGLATQDVSRQSPDHAVPVNPLSAQRVEVVRGPAVLRYGGGASAGVVNALTNRVPTSVPDKPIRGELVGIYGDNANERTLGAVIDSALPTQIGDFAMHFDGLLRKTEDYRTGGGDQVRQDGTDIDASSVSGGVSFLRDEGRLGFAFIRFDNEYGIPEDEPVDIDMQTNRYRFEADLDGPVKGVRQVNVRGIYSDYRHDEVVEGVTGQTFENDELDIRAELLHEPLFGFLGAVGIHGRTQDLEASGEAAEFLAPSDTDMVALYLFEEVALTDYLDTEIGLRVEGHWVEGTPIDGRKRDRGFVPVSGSVALNAHPWEDWSFGAMLAASQRAPAQVELFARGPHEATGTFEIGDPTFDEETSFTGELRFKGNPGRVRLEGAAFVTWYGDFIFGELSGVTVDEEGNPDPDGDLDQLFYKERNSIFYGGEAKLGVDIYELFGGWIGTDWQIDYVRARFTNGSGNRNVPRMPPMKWGASLFYEHDRVSGRFGFLRREKQWGTASNEFRTDAYTMLDMSFRGRLPIYEDVVPLEVGVSVRNLLDVRARNAVAFNKDEVVLQGRSVFASLHARF